jgi:CBS-domain-containing membrane protein
MPVLEEGGRLLGIVTEIALLDHLLKLDHQHQADETIEPLIDPNVVVIRPNTPLETLMGVFSHNSVALIASGELIQGILTKIDILDFLSTKAP